MENSSDKRNGRKLDKNIGEAIGSSIKLIRISKKISQRNLAEALSTDSNYISRIEGGNANPSLQLIYDIAEMLDCSPYALLPYTKNPTQTFNVSYSVFDFNQILNNATPYQQHMIAKFAIWFLQQPLPF